MEGRMARKYGYGSPERVRPRWVVDTQQPPPLKQQQRISPSQQQQPPPPPPPPPPQRSSPPQQQQQQLQPGMKVPVVYYLSKNRHLEHPHFIEVPLSSREGLFLRDVIGRLNVLRGKSMASSHSWSCKRGYKNGFVWHDLSEDDLIAPTNGNEYILKGSELFDSSASDGCHHRSSNTSPKREASAGQDSPPPASNHPTVPEEELFPSAHRTDSNPANASNSPLGSDNSPTLAENKAWKPSTKPTNASTQTEMGDEQRRPRGNIRVVSCEEAERDLNQESRFEEGSEICPNEILMSPSKQQSNGKVETLETLIRAEARKMNNFRVLKEDHAISSSRSKLKATNVIMQLLRCGSTAVKDHPSFGMIHTYKPRSSHAKFPSPMASTPMVLGEHDCISEKPRVSVLRSENFFHGNIPEPKKHGKEEGKVVPILSNSSSFEDVSNCNLPDPATNKDRAVYSSRSNGLRETIKLASKQLKNEMSRSPILYDQRASFSANSDHHFSTVPTGSPNGSSLHSINVSSEKVPTSRFDYFKENDNVVKIEERLPSGARIVIQSRGPCGDSGGSFSP